jgi:hypothetical protein
LRHRIRHPFVAVHAAVPVAPTATPGATFRLGIRALEGFTALEALHLKFRAALLVRSAHRDLHLHRHICAERAHMGPPVDRHSTTRVTRAQGLASACPVDTARLAVLPRTVLLVPRGVHAREVRRPPSCVLLVAIGVPWGLQVVPAVCARRVASGPPRALHYTPTTHAVACACQDTTAWPAA